MDRHRSCAVRRRIDETGDTITSFNPTSLHHRRSAAARLSGPGVIRPVDSAVGDHGRCRPWWGDLRSQERGASLAEYGILAFVVSVAAIGTVALIGPKLVSLFDAASRWIP